MLTENTLNNGHYIKGQWQKGQGDNLLSNNPTNNQSVWMGKSATQTEVETAMQAALDALAPWSELSFNDRCEYVKRFAQKVTEKRADLIDIISLEAGKPYWESATEVSAVIGKIDLSIAAYEERCAEKIIVSAEANSHLRYKPHGVVAVLGAFNFPAHLSNGHIVPALLAGNTVLYKPSELTPGVASVIMDCWHQSGIPAGVINCLQGDVQTGKHLLNMPIQGVYFTGSYTTGKRIHQAFSEKPEVILALEMGGNNPLIIDDIRDINAGVYHTILSSFITAGQRCTCARRVFIANNANGDEFLKHLVQACQQIKVGGPQRENEAFMGPVISHQHALAHLKSQQQLINNGGKALLSMSLLAEHSGLLSPGIIDMSAATNLSDDEIFAPLIQVFRYTDFTDAIAQANQTRYGLVAGLISENTQHYDLFYKTIRAGLISWNRPTTGASSALPFGGIGHSGNHRPSGYFAADYCAYPIACQEQTILSLPEKRLPGIVV